MGLAGSSGIDVLPTWWMATKASPNTCSSKRASRANAARQAVASCRATSMTRPMVVTSNARHHPPRTPRYNSSLADEGNAIRVRCMPLLGGPIFGPHLLS